MNTRMRRFTENVYVQQIINPSANVTDASYPASGSFIDVSSYERFAFLVFVGATDDTSVTATVQAASAANGALTTVTSAAITATVIASGNPNKWAMIEVETRKLHLLGASHKFATLTVAATGGSATIMGGFFFGWRTAKLPPTFGADKAEIVYVDG